MVGGREDIAEEEQTNSRAPLSNLKSRGRRFLVVARDDYLSLIMEETVF